MDTVAPIAPRKAARRRVLPIALALALAAAGWWYFTPSGLRVAAKEVRMAQVRRGMFLDQIILRARALPSKSIVLDSIESGKVEELFVRDGAPLKAQQLLFRLSNPQRRLELLAREADRAQQISNLSNLRVVLESTRTEHERRTADLAYDLSEAEKGLERTTALAQQGFMGQATLRDAADKVGNVKRQQSQQLRSFEAELAIKTAAVKQMEGAIATLDSGLTLMGQALDALTVRAPLAGRLTDFHLQVGETVQLGQHLGRIDDPSTFKLEADIDEFYLPRIKEGQVAQAGHGGATYALHVARIFPQVKDGRFRAEFEFAAQQPGGISPGQALDVTLSLGEPADALLLPNGAFVNDAGGAWVYVVGADGGTATRRPVRLGRRSTAQVEVLSGAQPGERVIVSSYAAFGGAAKLLLDK
ncbi:efflux RND transporter periplasmic adaptor subunit [Duganella sp. CT11-25]|uniref:efflux RND transporter periplasmic adaptor subunit n=1 Tax=unclassified Duganella TaxID=2636909 RepID=UPI0039B09DAF